MIGNTISHYKILEKLGEGGMGVVYKAEDTKLKRTVALKFLPLETVAGKEEKARFEHEAQAAAALDHPNICTVHEINEADGQTFIVMAYVEGQSLHELLIDDRQLPIDDVLNYATQAAEGLQAAHEKEIVHRDIKTANILITEKGQVRITDFGLAKLAGRTQLTKEGTSMGTVAYMSPEQTLGIEVDHRTDIWALGGVIYEMITGKQPFVGDYEQAIVYSIMNEEPEPPTALRTGVPMELERIVSKALTKEPGERYQRVDEMLVDLKNLRKSRESGVLTKTGIRGKPDGRKKHSYLMPGIIAGILTVGVAGYFLLTTGEKRRVSDRKLLVVLPFENLGPNDEQYFADGMTEEITSRLATIKSLGVISRKSALTYKDTDKTIKQIAEELGVDYVLGGTVRWARAAGGPERVRITPQLIQAHDDTHIWSDSYERIIEDIFQVQSEIAHNVVEQLGITLVASERENLETIPTGNTEAYHAFLRGKYFLGRPHFTYDTWQRGIDNLQQAVELDSNFALAYAELSRAHSRLYFVRYDLTQARLDKARQAAERALQLADSPEVHLKLGYYYLWAQRDNERALQEFMIAEKDLPNSVELLKAKSSLYQTLGKWQKFTDTVERAVELSPRDPSVLTELTFAYWYGHQYKKAMSACNRAIAIAPETTWPYLYKANIIWSATGPNDISREALGNVSPEHGWWLWSWYWEEVLAGNYRQALALLPKTDGNWMNIKIFARPKSLMAAVIYDFLNQKELASAAYDSARVLLQEEITNSKEDPRYHSSLGIAYAGLDWREDAIREGKKAVELLPISKDAVYGACFVWDLAVIYTMTGNTDLALEQIEVLLSNPSPVSKSWLERDIRFSALYDHPGFIQLLEKYSGEDL